MAQKIIIGVFLLLFACAVLYVLYNFGMHKEKENKEKYELKINENNKLIDSLKKVSIENKIKLDTLKNQNNILKTKEKIITQTIFIKDEKISKIKSMPNVLPDSANYRFFSEFEADTTSKR